MKILEVFNEIITQIRQHKAKNKLAQNAELGVVRISSPEEIDEELIEELKKISKIKTVETIKGELTVSF